MATQALRAILPAWTAAGNSIQQLAAVVVEALPRVLPRRRLRLLSALVSALPQVGFVAGMQRLPFLPAATCAAAS